jgi:hypothetical protein
MQEVQQVGQVTRFDVAREGGSNRSAIPRLADNAEARIDATIEATIRGDRGDPADPSTLSKIMWISEAYPMLFKVSGAQVASVRRSRLESFHRETQCNLSRRLSAVDRRTQSTTKSTHSSSLSLSLCVSSSRSLLILGASPRVHRLLIIARSRTRVRKHRGRVSLLSSPQRAAVSFPRVRKLLVVAYVPRSRWPRRRSTILRGSR